MVSTAAPFQIKLPGFLPAFSLATFSGDFAEYLLTSNYFSEQSCFFTSFRRLALAEPQRTLSL
jgi:hypothetical protein